ncbi:MAG: hypothetical protein KBT27_09340 [Prevotellaceae bacterium]|nr:hypothetical protein [Candidatus Faecinaster equi]
MSNENFKRLPNIEVSNAKLIWKNFSGADYNGSNPDHKRKFCLVLENYQMAQELFEAGWNVKIRPDDKDAHVFMQENFRNFPEKLRYCMEQGIENQTTYFIEVFLRFDLDYYPCVIEKYVNDIHSEPVLLSEDEVGLLDRATILRADVSVRPKFWKNPSGTKTGITAMLSNMKVLVANDKPAFFDEWGITVEE